MTPYSITLDTFFGDWGGGNIDSNVDMDNNNLETTGNITADTYFGDGSQLTGINSMNYTNLALTNETNTFTKNQTMTGTRNQLGLNFGLVN